MFQHAEWVVVVSIWFIYLFFFLGALASILGGYGNPTLTLMAECIQYLFFSHEEFSLNA